MTPAVRILLVVLTLAAAVWVIGVLRDQSVVTAPRPEAISDVAPRPIPVEPSIVESPCDHVIGTDVTKFDGASVAPGEVVCLTAGPRSALRLQNLQGLATAPIVIVNLGGVVQIEGTESDYAGIDVRASEHLVISGTGVESHCGAEFDVAMQDCGIVIRGTGRGIAGTERTGGISIDHVEVSDTAKSAIFIRTSAAKGATRDDWTQVDTRVDRTYLHDIGTEGLYLGGSSYADGKDPLLRGVVVSRNLVISTGWDGIQVGSAVEDCTIEHNRVIRPAEANKENQRTGIINNRGSICDITNNVVIDAMSDGIFVQGNGGNRIYNNLIVRPGREIDGDGIVVTSGSGNERPVLIWFNTVVSPRGRGIRFSNTTGEDHQILGNLLVEPGWPDPSRRLGIEVKDRSIVRVESNLVLTSIESAKFADPSIDDYRLLADSPAVDSAGWWQGIPGDHFGITRTTPDVGAFEYVAGPGDAS